LVELGAEINFLGQGVIVHAVAREVL
jgi:hypothetical protein